MPDHRTFVTHCTLGAREGLLTLHYEPRGGRWRAILVLRGPVPAVRRSTRQTSPVNAAAEALGGGVLAPALARYCADCERAVSARPSEPAPASGTTSSQRPRPPGREHAA